MTTYRCQRPLTEHACVERTASVRGGAQRWQVGLRGQAILRTGRFHTNQREWGLSASSPEISFGTLKVEYRPCFETDG